jgi:polyisoprenyl-teichoic acid--peptidoglycan teichoic acid transferase
VNKKAVKVKRVNNNQSQIPKPLKALINSFSALKPKNKKNKGKNNQNNPQNSHQKSNKSGSLFFKGLVWGATFTITVSISASLGAGIALVLPFTSAQESNGESKGLSLGDIWSKLFSQGGFKSLLGYKISRPVNILVLGIDRNPDSPLNSLETFSGRSDTILLVRFDPRDHSLKMLSIPRDTRIEGEGLSLPKINQANADGGAALTARVVSKTLNNIPIDRYVRVTTDAFVELVDLVGGVEVFVPQPMHYVDQTQKLEINLEPGWQTLNGEQAEQFARFRSDRNGDIGRVQRQQMLLKALKQRVQNPGIITKVPEIIKILQQYVDTNLSVEEMLSLATFAKDLQQENFTMVMLPGRFSGTEEYQLSYWIMAEQEKDQIMQRYFDQNSFSENNSTGDRSPQQIRIAIQNATDEPEIAQKVARYLRQNDFTQVYLIRDSREKLRQTEIIAQKGDLEAAQLIQRVLKVGIPEAASTGDLESDITIRIGEDWLQTHN